MSDLDWDMLIKSSVLIAVMVFLSLVILYAENLINIIR